MNFLIETLLAKLESGIDHKDVRYFDYGKTFTTSKARLDKGIIMVNPLSTGIAPVTTGVTDEDTFAIEIILAKNIQNSYYRDAQREPEASFLVRVMEGRDQNRGLLTNTIRYVVRSNFKNIGLLQNNISIEYDTEDVSNFGVATAKMMITQIDHTSQLIS